LKGKGYFLRGRRCGFKRKRNARKNLMERYNTGAVLPSFERKERKHCGKIQEAGRRLRSTRRIRDSFGLSGKRSLGIETSPGGGAQGNMPVKGEFTHIDT